MPDITDIAPFERHTFPNGLEVFYRDDNHSYWKGVKWNVKEGRWGGTGRLTGVSTVVGPLDFRPDTLMRWAARTNCDGVAALAADALSTDDPAEIREALRFLASGDSIWWKLEQNGLLYNQAKDRAADRGTNVHELALHALAEGRRVPDLAAMTDEERGYAQAVIKFWLDHSPRALQFEQVVADPDLGIAGRFDLRAALHGDDPDGVPLAGAICLVDAKTSGFIPNKHHAQLSGYDLLAETCGVGASDRLFILQLAGDGEYELIEATASREHFLNAVRTYRDANTIGGAAKKARANALARREAVAA